MKSQGEDDKKWRRIPFVNYNTRNTNLLSQWSFHRDVVKRRYRRTREKETYTVSIHEEGERERPNEELLIIIHVM